MKESHIYKGSLNTFISTIIKHICMSGLVSSECAAALIVASLGPGAGCEGGGVVTRHTLHSALRANCSPAADWLHEMAGHSDTQCKTEIRRDLSDSFLRYECFIQPINLLRENYGHYADTFTFDSFCYEAFISSSLPSEQEAMMEATAWQKC